MVISIILMKHYNFHKFSRYTSRSAVPAVHRDGPRLGASEVRVGTPTSARRPGALVTESAKVGSAVYNLLFSESRDSRCDTFAVSVLVAPFYIF